MKPSTRGRNLKKASILILCLGLSVWGFKSLQVSTLVASAQERYSDLQIFSKVLNLVQQYYVEPIDTKKMIYGAIKGMLRELDPHTSFMPPDLFKDFENETSGEFGGLGVEITVQNSVLTVIAPIEDTPAWDAGVQSGDKIVSVDGHSTKGLSLVEASQLMRGKKGSKTVLSIIRGNSDTPVDYSITRASVRIKSVKYTDLGDGYAYAKVTSFIENTGKDLEKVLLEHEKKNSAVKGLVLDLRRNPGGLLDQAVKVSDLFLADGKIVSTRGRDQTKEEVQSATKRGRFTNFPLIILLNGYSASASEIVAGALQDNKRAIVMGEKSFGKGSVQSVVKLGDGSGLKLTVARYYTPSGKSIQAEGITPDIELKDAEVEPVEKPVAKGKSIREKDIQGHLEGDEEKRAAKTLGAETWWKDGAAQKEVSQTPRDKMLSSDYQVFQAYNYLKAWKLMRGIGENKTTL